MAGIYIHIPFCKRKCHYCNFHLSASMRYRGDVVRAIVKEIEQTKDFLKGRAVETVYFGGGTPSVLLPEELDMIFQALQRHYDLSRVREMTLECNPDDVSKAFSDYMRDTPIDRYSLGIQSFFDEDLEALNRVHDRAQVFQAMEYIGDLAGDRWTVDLIYGLPKMSMERWMQNLKMLVEYRPPHFSAYALTVEQKTALHHFIQNKMLAPPDESQTIAHLEYLLQWAEENGYEHYEISNFAQPGRRAMHNSAYWASKPYLGLGPGAHSFDGEQTRRWNVSNNPIYVRNIAQSTTWYEEEVLTEADRFNEMVMTRLRLREGVGHVDLLPFGKDYIAHFEREITPYVTSGMVEAVNGRWKLSRSGIFLADHIASELFLLPT